MEARLEKSVVCCAAHQHVAVWLIESGSRCTKLSFCGGAIAVLLQPLATIVRDQWAMCRLLDIVCFHANPSYMCLERL